MKFFFFVDKQLIFRGLLTKKSSAASYFCIMLVFIFSQLVVARYCRRFVEQAMVPDDADNETESRDLVKKTKQEKGNKDNDSDKPTNAPTTQATEETGETEKGQQGKLGDVMNALQ